MSEGFTAAQLLDKACKAESAGNDKLAQTAFKLALKKDAMEAERDDCSLPRK